ncbi:DUF2059 domain-containing protein [Oryzicola mucosus]|uniref:DUF2059 domain-containing protein n=1 Tax=Oryzicola mucosus TaxID=2767425 RepID=A0A8J6U0X4_9HYPH|nr:DUF2059 domain-containing protein [Oryzicola mucosus]MBD0416171.1 DUF2059 domain-containing protein [Oryzicola mucosus]
MILTTRLRRFSTMATASAFLAIASVAQAQEVSETHLKAAQAAISAIHATDSFDMILPQAAGALKEQLIQQSPDLDALITQTVDEKTLALASRRADLEKEAALVYARSFTEPQLKAIAAFYNSEAGKKLLSDGPIVSREIVKAADIWQNGIARDLAEQVGETLRAQAPNSPAANAASGATPAVPATPN